MKKLFYDSQEESIENFKKIFAKKSGEDWDHVNVFAVQEKYERNTSDIKTGFNSWNSQELFAKLTSESSTSHENTNPDFKKLIMKYMKILHLETENDSDQSCKKLSTKSIERCLCEYGNLILIFLHLDILFYQNSHPESIVQANRF